MPKFIAQKAFLPADTRARSRKAASVSAPAMQAWLSVVRTYHLCDAVMTQRLAGLGLRLPEHEVLVNLLTTPGMSQQQLAQRCFVAKSGVSMLVSRLVAQGWLQREADALDARVWRLSLTPEGEALATQARQMQAEVVSAMTGARSAAELQALSAAMGQAGQTLEAMLA